MARKHYLMTQVVLRELAMGSDSDMDMEPKDDDFQPDGDASVAESSNEAELHEPVYFL